jgi:hypothetical protein
VINRLISPSHPLQNTFQIQTILFFPLPIAVNALLRFDIGNLLQTEQNRIQNAQDGEHTSHDSAQLGGEVQDGHSDARGFDHEGRQLVDEEDSREYGLNGLHAGNKHRETERQVILKSLHVFFSWKPNEKQQHNPCDQTGIVKGI